MADALSVDEVVWSKPKTLFFFRFGRRFSHMQQPSTEMIYDSLAQLMQERKIYQTAKGYFIVTPEWVSATRSICDEPEFDFPFFAR